MNTTPLRYFPYLARIVKMKNLRGAFDMVNLCFSPTLCHSTGSVLECSGRAFACCNDWHLISKARNARSPTVQWTVLHKKQCSCVINNFQIPAGYSPKVKTLLIRINNCLNLELDLVLDINTKYFLYIGFSSSTTVV